MIDYFLPYLHHQGGWDEMLWFVMPVLLLTWFRKKQTENQEE
jgi:hypothetical protein